MLRGNKYFILDGTDYPITLCSCRVMLPAVKLQLRRGRWSNGRPIKRPNGMHRDPSGILSELSPVFIVNFA